MKKTLTTLRVIITNTALFSVLSLLTFLAPTASEAQQCNFNNPIIHGNFPDPWMMEHDGWYYWCKQDYGNSLTVERTRGQLPGVAPTEGWTKVWTVDNNIREAVWAPELHFINGKWYIYASGDTDGAPGLQNLDMFVLEADNWNGPYHFLGSINTWDFRPEWCIDPNILIHPTTGQLYMAWSQWEGGMQCIYIGEMDSPSHLKNAVKLSQPDYDWEKKPNNDLVNEGPQFLIKNNTVHIAYSASQCHSRYYSLGLLTANLDHNLTDKASWSKSATPVFREGQGAWGPGHNCFVKSPDGTEDWIVYHAHTDGAWEDAQERGDRSIFAQAFTWNGDYPVFGPPQTGGTYKCPSTDGGIHTPWGGTAATIPGTVEAENFDVGRNGSAYSDADLANLSSEYRNDGVDVEICGEGGYNVDWTAANEWIKYTVNVTKGGRYKVNFRVASVTGTAAIHLEVDGIDKTGIISIPNTAGWQAWQNVERTIILPGGQQVLTLFINTGGVNINKMTFTKDFQESNGTGLTGEYFNGMNFETKELTRVDETINFNWEASSPDAAINNDNFSVRWTGAIEPLYSENYTFYINSDNGRRLWINDQLIIDKWLGDWGTEYSGKITLEAEQKYTFKMEYFEEVGGANAKLEWGSTSQPRQVISKTQLYPNSLVTGFPSNELFKLNVFPNPANSTLTIQSYGSEIEHLSVSDLQGKVIYEKSGVNSNEITLDISNLVSKGTYLVAIKTQTGTSFQKVVVN